MLTWCGRQSKPKFKAKKSSKSNKTTGVRFAEVNLNEDESASEGATVNPGPDDDDEEDEEEEEEEEEGDSDEFIDVLDVLDGRGEPDPGEEEGKGSARRNDAGGIEHETEDMEDEADEDEDAGEDEELEEAEEDEDVNEDEGMNLSADEADDTSPAALDNLGKFISSLDTGTKRKAEDAGLEVPRRKRRVIQERTEAGAENEFAAHVAGM